MDLVNVCVVLTRPEEDGNIGSACRAMANCDVKTLRIVGRKKSSIKEEKAKALAVHAAGVFDEAEYYLSIEDATKDCTLSLGFTRRKGQRRGKLLLMNDVTKTVDKVTSGGGKVALVFGNEKTGLTDEELAACTQAVTIQSSKDFGSLNLSHAVQIACYTLFCYKSAHKSAYLPITLKRLKEVVLSMTRGMKSVGFFTKVDDKIMSRFWMDVLSRAVLSEGEAKYIEETFLKFDALAKKKVGE